MTTQNPLGLACITALLFAIALCAFSAFDNSPSDIEAMQATAASVQDGQEAEQARLKMIAAQAHKQAVRAKKQAQELAQQTQTQTASAQ